MHGLHWICIILHNLPCMYGLYGVLSFLLLCLCSTTGQGHLCIKKEVWFFFFFMQNCLIKCCKGQQLALRSLVHTRDFPLSDTPVTLWISHGHENQYECTNSSTHNMCCCKFSCMPQAQYTSDLHWNKLLVGGFLFVASCCFCVCVCVCAFFVRTCVGVRTRPCVWL